MKYLLILFLIGANAAFGQLTFSGNSNTFGRGTGVATSIDFFALNSNPSNLGWQSRFYEHKLSFKLFDAGLMLSSPVSFRDARNIISQASSNEAYTFLPFKGFAEIFWSYDTLAPNDPESIRYDTNYTLENRLKVRDDLMQRTSYRFNRILFSASYTTDHYGTFAIQVSNEINASLQLSELNANLFTLGKINPYFDSLVLASGAVIANRPSGYSNDTLSQIVHAFSNDSLTIGQQLNGSYLNIIRTRNYSFGWGNSYKALIPGWETYIGATLNLIEGQSYYEWETRDNEFFLRNADRRRTNTNLFRNPGAGASVSLAMSFVKNDKFILGASLNNLGFIHWRSGKDNMTMEYNSLDEKNMFDYPFGTPKDIDFRTQLVMEANISIATGKNYDEHRVRFTTATPANLSLGAQWKVNRVIALSSDIILPINPNAVGSYRTPYLSLGTEFLFERISLSTGINNSFNQFNVPFGITFGSLHSRGAFTIATNNLLHYFQDKTIRNYTLCAGFTLRFK